MRRLSQRKEQLQPVHVLPGEAFLQRLHGPAVRVLDLLYYVLVAAAGHVRVAPQRGFFLRRQGRFPSFVVVQDHFLVALVQVIVHCVPVAAVLILQVVGGRLELLLNVGGVYGGTDHERASDVVDCALDVVLGLVVVTGNVIGQELILVLEVLVRDVFVDD